MPRNYSKIKKEKVKIQRLFTDREEFQEAFWKRINRLNSDEQSVLYYYGVGGIGKSALLRELRKQLINKNESLPNNSDKVAWGWVDFQIENLRQAPRALLELREILAENSKIGFPTFDLAYAHYYLKSYHKEYREGLSDLASKIRAGEFTKEILFPIIEEIPVLSSILKAGNLLFKTLDAGQEKIIIKRHKDLKAFLLEQDPLRMTDGLIEFFAEDLRSAYRDDRPIVLFLDTLEALTNSESTKYSGEQPDEWVELLANYLPGVLIVIAGRRRIDWSAKDKDWVDRDLLEMHLIGKLEENDAYKFLSNAGLPSKIIEVTLKEFHGLPFYLDITLDLFDQGRIDNESNFIADYYGGGIDKIINRFLSYLSPQEQSAVRVLSAPNTFQYGRFQKLMQKFATAYPQDFKSYQQLLKYSLFVSDGEVCYVHQIARKFLESEEQNKARKFIVDDIEDKINNISVENFVPSLYLLIEEAFDQVRFLRGDLEGVTWLNSNVELFKKADRLGLLKSVFQRALSICINQSNPHDFCKSSTKNNLAKALYNLGQTQQSLAFFKQAYQESLRISGADDLYTINYLNDLAYCLQALEKYDEALPKYEEALEKLISVQGKSHYDTISCMNNLAYCLTEIGKVDEGYTIYEEAFQLSTNKYGANDTITVKSLHNLAYSLYNLGEINTALAKYREAYRIRIKILGERHPDTIGSLRNQAYCLDSLEKWTESLVIYEKVLQLFKTVSGENHPETIGSYYNLGNCLKKIGNFKDALSKFQGIKERVENKYGQDHPFFTSVEENIAFLNKNID